MFHKGHKKVLKNKINDFKRQCEESIINKLVTKEMKVFGKNKSKYLIEVHMKITLLQTENHELYFISSLSKSSSFFHTAHISNDEPSCYILTNKNLFINNFTANAISFLGEELKKYGSKVMLTYGGGSIKKNGIYDQFCMNSGQMCCLPVSPRRINKSAEFCLR